MHSCFQCCRTITSASDVIRCDKALYSISSPLYTDYITVIVVKFIRSLIQCTHTTHTGAEQREQYGWVEKQFLN